MGMSTSKSTTKPVYGMQLEGAGKTLTDVYNRNAPQIQQNSDMLSGLMPGLAERFTQGDPGVKAAQGYNTDVLSGRYLNEGNPYMQGMIDRSNNDIRNQTQAALGARGLTGGSDYAGLIADRVAKNTLATRYQDYGNERDRMDQAAGRAPGLSAADYIPLASMLGIADSANDPLQSAVGYTSGLGGLLGQYTNTKQKQAWGPIIAQMASNAAQAMAAGG